MSESRLHVVVVGGGIGGLFAANALIARGIKVSLYEQAPELGEVGAGVYVTPNSARHLVRLGLGPALEKLTQEDPTFRVAVDEETGQTLISGMLNC